MKLDFGPWTPDVSDAESSVSDAKNCVPQEGKYGQFLGLTTTSDALAAKPLGAISTSNIGGVVETYAGTETNIYRLDAPAWTAVTGAAISPPASGVASMEFAQFNNRVYVATYGNLLRSKQIGLAGNFTAITDSPKARRVDVVRNFVVCGDINDPVDGEKPWRIRWSSIDNPESWPLAGTATAYANQSDEQDLKAEDGAVQAIVGFDYGLIFQENAITRMTYVGSPLVFQMDKIDNRGAMSPDSVVAVGRSCYFISRDGIFRTDGAAESTPIGHGKVDRWFLDQIRGATLSNIRGGVDNERKLIFWSFQAGGAIDPNRVLIYHYLEDRWSYAEVNTTGLFTSRNAGYTLDNIDSFGTVDTITTPFDDPFWSGGQTFIAAFDSTYKLAQFSGAALTAVIETGLFGLDGRAGYLSAIRPLIKGGTITVQLAGSRLYGDTPSFTAARSVTSATGVADFRLSSMWFKARVNIAGGFTKADGVDAVVVNDDAAR